MHQFTVRDLQIALDIVEKRIAQKKEAKEAERIGHYYSLNNNPHKAIEYFLKLLEIAEELGYKDWVAVAHGNLGNAHNSICQYQMAMEHHKKHLEIVQQLGDIAGVGKAHASLGIVYQSIGQYQIAIEYHKKHLEIAEELDNKAGVGRAHGNIGNAYQSIGQYQMAIECHKKDLEIAKELGDQAGVGRAYGNLGNACLSIGQYQMAIECHKKDLAIAEKLNDRKSLERAHGNLGSAYNSIGQYQMSIECHNKHLEIAKELGDELGAGRAHGNLGNSYDNIGQYQMAIYCYTKALEIAEKLGSQTDAGRSHGNLGNAYHSIGQYQMAIECHKKHLKISEELGDQAGVGTAHGNLGNGYRSIGQYQMAIECHEKHLEIAEELGEQGAVGQAHGNLGNGYQSIGQYRMAIECHKKQLEIAEELDDQAEVGKAHANLGNVYNSIGQYQMAIECHRKHLEIAERLGDQAGSGQARGNVGDVYKNIGLYQMAIECYKKNLEVAEKVGDRAGVGRAYAKLGNAHHSSGQYEMAIECHKKYLKIAEEVGDQPGVGKAHAMLGNDYHSTGQYQMAIECYKTSIDIAGELGDIITIAKVHFSLGLVYQRDNDDRACRLFAKSILEFHNIHRNGPHQDKFNISMSNQFVQVHRFLLRSLLNLNQVKSALLVSDNGKANALYDLIRKYVDVVSDSSLAEQQISLFREISEDPSSQNMEMFFENALHRIVPFKQDGSIILHSFDPWNNLNMWVMSRGGVFHKQWQTKNGTSAVLYLEQLVEMVRESLWRVVRDCCILYPDNCDCDGKFERKVHENWNIKPLKEEEGAYVRDLEKRIRNIFTNSRPNHGLDYGRHPSGEKSVRERYHLEGQMEKRGSCCYSARNVKETDRAKRKLCEYYSLDMPGPTHTSRSRSRKPAINSMNAYTDTDVYLQKLYSILIAPIEEYLRGSKLLIVPDGPLFLLPFCALLDQKEVHLCEKYSLRVTPALQVLDASLLKPFSKLGPAFFVGNPTVGEVKFYGQQATLEALPNATDEAKECAKYFEAGPLLEENATKAKVLENMKDASVIHIAAHGHMDHADIFLAPNEGAPKPPSEKHYLLTARDILKCHLKARLVVLSCCHSGWGQISNEGVVGIARSFLGAGARSVLVTLWQIPDEETMQFMKQFYSKVCQGVSVCSALQETMIQFKKKVSISAWAPFQIVGEDIVLSKDEIKEIRRESSIRTSKEGASNRNDVHGGSDV